MAQSRRRQSTVEASTVHSRGVDSPQSRVDSPRSTVESQDSRLLTLDCIVSRGAFAFLDVGHELARFAEVDEISRRRIRFGQAFQIREYFFHASEIDAR